jgi:hypothetical protein
VAVKHATSRTFLAQDLRHSRSDRVQTADLGLVASVMASGVLNGDYLGASAKALS